jgi:hypothetical protein
MKTKFITYSFFFLSLLLVQTNTTFGQYERPREVSSNNVKRANIYLSLGSGLQYKYGMIGGGVGMYIGENTLGELTFGLGGYGFKTGVNMVFNSGSNKKWRPTLGFVRGSGISNFETEVEVVYNLNVKNVTTKINLPAAFALTPGVQRIFMFRNGSSFALDLGIGISLNQYEASFSEDQVLFDGVLRPSQMISFSDLQKTTFKVTGPSGIICGVSYNFGLGLK